MTAADRADGTGEAVRLSKRVAALVPCSRSEAERYIEGGWVRVDGEVVDVPQARVTPAQSVTLDSGASLLALTPVTVIVNEVPLAGIASPPEGSQMVAPANRWTQDPSGLRITPAQCRHLQPLLPLPPGASGLAVYSQDFRIVRKLTEDALAIEQEWGVQVEGQIAEGGLARLGSGWLWGGQAIPPLKASWQSEQRLRLAFKGTDPACIPWLCEQVGLTALQGRRIRLGRLPLAGLPPGQWRALMPHERC